MAWGVTEAQLKKAQKQVSCHACGLPALASLVAAAAVLSWQDLVAGRLLLLVCQAPDEPLRQAAVEDGQPVDDQPKLPAVTDML